MARINIHKASLTEPGSMTLHKKDVRTQRMFLKDSLTNMT